MGTCVFNYFFGCKAFVFGFPAFYLIDTTPWIFIKGYVEFFNKFRIFAFYIEGIVLGIMLASFGTIISKLVYVIKTNHIIMLAGSVFFFGSFFDFRIQIVSVFVADFQKPAHVVDSCNQITAAFN